MALWQGWKDYTVHDNPTGWASEMLDANDPGSTNPFLLDAQGFWIREQLVVHALQLLEVSSYHRSVGQQDVSTALLPDAAKHQKQPADHQNA